MVHISNASHHEHVYKPINTRFMDKPDFNYMNIIVVQMGIHHSTYNQDIATSMLYNKISHSISSCESTISFMSSNANKDL